MSIRCDAITLHDEAKAEDFERFMREELIPYFRERYKGPTRASYADLTNQSLLKDAEKQGKYLWITVWSGSSVQGSSFESTRIVKMEGTKEMLEKLESFGKRAPEKVFNEVEITNSNNE